MNEGPGAKAQTFEERIRDQRWALGRIGRQLGPRLGRFVDAEDVLQDVLCTAFRHRAQIERLDPPQFRSWLQRVALRRILLLARGMRTRTRPRRDTCLPPSHVAHVDGATLDAGAGATLAGSAADGGAPLPRPTDPQARPGAANPVIPPLAVLRGEDQRVLWLRENFALSWESVSFLLVRTSGASRQLHYRARRRLGRAPALADVYL